MSCDPLPRLQQQVDPLVGAHQAEAQHDRHVRLEGSAAQPLLRTAVGGEMGEHAVGDHVDPLRVHAQLACQALATVLGVDDDRVEALVQAALGGELARAGLARHDVVGGEHERPAQHRPGVAPAGTGGGAGAARTGGGAGGGQQVAIEVLNREPLEVHDVSRARGAAVAEHVGDVLGQLCEALRAGARRKAGVAVEELAPLVPRRRRDGAVGEAAREQLDLGPRRPQRLAERVVIRRRVGGRIDDLDTHGKDNRRAGGDNGRMTPPTPARARR